MKKILGALAAAAMMLAPQVASALTVFSFSFAGTTDRGVVSGSGILKANTVDSDPINDGIQRTVYEIFEADGTFDLGGTTRTIKDLGVLVDEATGEESGNFLTSKDGDVSLYSVVFSFNQGTEYVALSLGDFAFGVIENRFFEGDAQFDVAAVPEPATWAMMLLGFGAIGVAMRRRRASVAFAG